MAAKKLSEKSNIQVVSTDVRRINTKIEANLLLDPKKKFIVNPDKRSGYRVNEVYEITIS
jgi:hypothetical protein